jgi:molecular chaperone DnaK
MVESKTPVFGIDLGTTYSCIAYVDEYGRPVVVANAEGQHVTPSVVQFSGAERIVGKAAKESSVLYPNETVEMVKRFMGSSESFAFLYEGRNYTPEEISSYILRKVVQDAEQQTGMKITDVVITCPAYFGIPEREATANAGKIAGLNVLSIINEPTAAAITYGTNEQSDQTVLVYDLGGGTFDITVIRIESGSITVVATGGDHNLGGRNWDERVVQYFAEEWQSQTGSSEDPLSSSESSQDLYNRAEQAKITLTGREKTDIPVIHEGQRARVTLTRDKFDELTSDLLERTIEMTNQLLQEASSRGVHKIDQLLLVGGSTLMPQVMRRLATEYGAAYGLTPRVFEPSEAVAKGAAIFGYRLSINQEIVTRMAEQMGVAPEKVNLDAMPTNQREAVEREVASELGLTLKSVKEATTTKVTNVTSRSFGVIAWERNEQRDVVSNLIRVNDPLPATITQTFGTAEANQTLAHIQIVDNLSSAEIYKPEDSRVLGETEMQLPRGLPEGSPIEITFHLNEQGRLQMTARELTDGREANVELQTEAIMSAEEVENAAKRATRITVS